MATITIKVIKGVNRFQLVKIDSLERMNKFIADREKDELKWEYMS